MFANQAEFSEVILLYGKHSISKQMPYTEFEAILDTYATVPEFASQDARAVYLVVDFSLNITACVFFLIDFMDDGSVNKSWNIPLRHMAEIAAPGPDLGSGPVRLVCRSQCPIAWQQSNTWDPEMNSNNDDFRLIAGLIRENKLCLSTQPPRQSNVEHSPQGPAWGGGASPQAQQWSAAPSYAAPAMTGGGWPQAAQNAPEQAWQAVNQPWSQVPPQPQQTAVPTLLTTQPYKELQWKSRLRTARRIKKLRLKLHTLTSNKRRAVAELKYAQHKQLEKNKIEKRRLKNFVHTLTEQNEALKEQALSQRAQVEALESSVEVKLENAAENEKKEIIALKQHFQQRIEEKESEEFAKLKEQLQVKEMELLYKEEIMHQLQEETCSLRSERIRLVGAGADNFLGKLETLGISFINYHPGVGHLSIPIDDMAEYMEDTDAYVAEKALLSKDKYLQWKRHYDHPSCDFESSAGQRCDARVDRLEVPGKYIHGETNRCALHRSKMA